MTSTRDKLIMMYACDPMLRWIGNRSIEQAWRECNPGLVSGEIDRTVAAVRDDGGDLADRGVDFVVGHRSLL